MPEEKKGRGPNPLVDEDGNFIGRLYPVTWSHPREEEPKPEHIPIRKFLIVLFSAFAFVLLALGIVAVLS